MMADIDIQKLFCIFISFHWNCDYLQEICITMTLQWTAVAFFLYAEIGLNLILCIPFISAKWYCSITHVPSVRVSCHCCPFLTVIRLTVFLSSVMQLAFGFPLENMEVVVSILEQMLLHYDYGFDRSFTGWVLLTDCPHHSIISHFCSTSDAVREVQKYSGPEPLHDAKANPNVYDHVHMKLFRAQRNLYISGFSLFLWLWVYQFWG